MGEPDSGSEGVLKIFNRPGVAGAVLQSPLSLINSFSPAKPSSLIHSAQTINAIAAKPPVGSRVECFPPPSNKIHIASSFSPAITSP